MKNWSCIWSISWWANWTECRKIPNISSACTWLSKNLRKPQKQPSLSHRVSKKWGITETRTMSCSACIKVMRMNCFVEIPFRLNLLPGETYAKLGFRPLEISDRVPKSQSFKKWLWRVWNLLIFALTGSTFCHFLVILRTLSKNVRKIWLFDSDRAQKSSQMGKILSKISIWQGPFFNLQRHVPVGRQNQCPGVN